MRCQMTVQRKVEGNIDGPVDIGYGTGVPIFGLTSAVHWPVREELRS